MNTEQIRQRYSDRYEYYQLCVEVVGTRGTQYESGACRVLRTTMAVLGYPAESSSWDDARTLMYAENIVAIG